MATRFVLHPFGDGESTSDDDLVSFPTYSQKTWTLDRVVSQLENSSSGTIDVGFHEAPADDDDLYSSVHTFSSVTDGSNFPVSDSTTLSLRTDSRWMRVKTEISGSGTWHFKAESKTTFFEPDNSDHTKLLQDSRYWRVSDFTSLAQNAEDDVVSHNRVGGNSPLDIGIDEGADEAIRRAIAARIEWRVDRFNLAADVDNTVAEQRLNRLEGREWDREDDILGDYEHEPPVWAL